MSGWYGIFRLGLELRLERDECFDCSSGGSGHGHFACHSNGANLRKEGWQELWRGYTEPAQAEETFAQIGWNIFSEVGVTADKTAVSNLYLVTSYEERPVERERLGRRTAWFARQSYVLDDGRSDAVVEFWPDGPVCDVVFAAHEDNGSQHHWLPRADGTKGGPAFMYAGEQGLVQAHEAGDLEKIALALRQLLEETRQYYAELDK